MKLKTIKSLPPFFEKGEILTKEEWAKRLNLSEETIEGLANQCEANTCFEEVSDDITLTSYLDLGSSFSIHIGRTNNAPSAEESKAIITNINKAFPDLNDLLKSE